MLRLALAQINPTVGDLLGNADKIADFVGQAQAQGADMVVFPELAICGYPPEDLLLRQDFLDDCLAATYQAAQAGKNSDMAIVIGCPVDEQSGTYNSLTVWQRGRLRSVYHKMHLPNYGVFDERRYFQTGNEAGQIVVNGTLVGLTVCEDIWIADGPIATQARTGAQLLVNISASPYHRGKGQERMQMLSQRAKDNNIVIAYVNQVGGQDELVFDGHSQIIDHRGQILASGAQFDEQLMVADIPVEQVRASRRRDPRLLDKPASAQVLGEFVCDGDKPTLPSAAITQPMCWQQEMYEALVLATRDYLGKSRISQALLGLSGGIDSALVALIAYDAIGPENLTCIVMPSRFSSDHTQSDARSMAENMGANLVELPIGNLYNLYLQELEGTFAGKDTDVTEENIQARIRANLLMAYSNKFGGLLLSTGNKSEMATGYSTLGGDLMGGFAVIKDVPKTMVFELTRWRNERSPDPASPLCPVGIIERPPSAELREDQADTDSLPPYEILDAILAAYIEQDMSPEDIVAAGYDAATVERVIKLLTVAEFKRRQAPPGPRITPRNLSRDRRMPIVNQYRRPASVQSINEV